ncbi:carboxymuconolactone decarboxylase family protein [Streptomyces sp. NPDC058401]|uniref:carboxymuconolactone decarboxylase family protein n=1 Tax=Streptomyces sp. NPDC058401 TaxID=3346480 RepID=UPI003647876B
MPSRQGLLAKVEAALGVTPNMMRAMAASPAVLDGCLPFGGALSKGLLPGSLREQIALVSAAENSCDYCYAAHHVLGARAGAVALNVFTNCFDSVARTEVDFPAVDLPAVA